MRLLAATVIGGPVHPDLTKSPDLLVALFCHGIGAYEVAAYNLNCGSKLYPDRPCEAGYVKWDEACRRWEFVGGRELNPAEVYFGEGT